jgi:CheY-like chemotaxis protein
MLDQNDIDRKGTEKPLTRILVVEDDPLVREIIKNAFEDFKALSKRNYEVLMLSDVNNFLHNRQDSMQLQMQKEYLETNENANELLNRELIQKKFADCCAVILDLNLIKTTKNGVAITQFGDTHISKFMEYNMPTLVYTGSSESIDGCYRKGAFFAYDKAKKTPLSLIEALEKTVTAKDKVSAFAEPALPLKLSSSLATYKNIPSEENRLSFLAALYRTISLNTKMTFASEGEMSALESNLRQYYEIYKVTKAL